MQDIKDQYTDKEIRDIIDMLVIDGYAKREIDEIVMLLTLGYSMDAALQHDM